MTEDNTLAQVVTVIDDSTLLEVPTATASDADKTEIVSREDIDHLVLQTLFLTRFLVDK